MPQIGRHMRRTCLACAVVTASHLEAHTARDITGLPQTWEDLPHTWGLEPGVIAMLAIALVLYVRGCVRVWRRVPSGGAIRGRELGCFLGGWLALAIALVSPLHPWGGVLFSAHMIQHEVLMLIAAPLLVLGKPLVA